MYQTLFAIASAPLCSPIHIIPTIVWVWTHILQFDIANQIKAPEEDKVNKPSRPLPAGRISLRNATILRWLIAPLCLAYSALFSTQLMFASLEMQLFTFWYNELDGDKNWLSKNAILALMYGCMELGGTLSAGTSSSRTPTVHSAHRPPLPSRLRSFHSQRNGKARSPAHHRRLHLDRALPRLQRRRGRPYHRSLHRPDHVPRRIPPRRRSGPPNLVVRPLLHLGYRLVLHARVRRIRVFRRGTLPVLAHARRRQAVVQVLQRKSNGRPGCFVRRTDVTSHRSGSRFITCCPDTGITSMTATRSAVESSSNKPGTCFRVQHC